MGSTAKIAVREEIRRRLSGFSPGARQEASRTLVQIMTAQPEWSAAVTVGLYLSLPDEPETRGLIRQAWDEGKRVALPKTDIRQGLTWWEIKPGPLPQLETLWEPLPEKHGAVELETIDGFCVPGRAFDSQGTRLGRGGGHYDRALVQRSRKAWITGFFFGIQEVENLPREVHDVALPCVVTEKGRRNFL